MIFYEVLGNRDNERCIVGTQVDAKRLARDRGTSWDQVNIPTDKDGLMAFVNDLMSKAVVVPDSELISPRLEAASQPAPIATFRNAPKPGDPAEELGNWLYETADDHYIYEVFSALSSRFRRNAVEARS